MLESELASPIPLLLQQHYRKPKILFTQSLDEANPALCCKLWTNAYPNSQSAGWLISFSLDDTADYFDDAASSKYHRTHSWYIGRRADLHLGTTAAKPGDRHLPWPRRRDSHR